MTPGEVGAWRAAERRRLLTLREAVAPATREEWRRLIDGHLTRAFPGLASATLAFCWPIRGEYDARPLAQRLRDGGATTALPAVVARGAPLVFRAWHPGVPLAAGPLGIPYPADSSSEVTPTALLVPMIGWDAAGHRLGYGGGYFDRTLASMPRRPWAIGVGYELGALPTIHPQAWDVPMDWVVTERGVYRRDPSGLAFLGQGAAGVPGPLASPVCYADEVAPGDPPGP
jgi:5-formyltetrahydrofolate cyclo-ligase